MQIFKKWSKEYYSHYIVRFYLNQIIFPAAREPIVSGVCAVPYTVRGSIPRKSTRFSVTEERCPTTSTLLNISVFTWQTDKGTWPEWNFREPASEGHGRQEVPAGGLGQCECSRPVFFLWVILSICDWGTFFLIVLSRIVCALSLFLHLVSSLSWPLTLS